MTPLQIVLQIVSPALTVAGAVVALAYRLGRQDKALEYLMRQAEETSRKGGTIPPPREKLATLTEHE